MLFQAENSFSCIPSSLEAIADMRKGTFYIAMFFLYILSLRLDRIKDPYKYFPMFNQEFFSVDKHPWRWGADS